MAFWDDFEDESSALINKLDDASVPLKTIVGDAMCLMLIRDENPKIIDYFARPSIFRQLFQGALNSDVDPTMNETQQYRFAYQCSEVLCYPYDKLYHAYFNDEETMNFLTMFLEVKKDQMNHLIASFFAKILLSLYNFDHSKVLEALSKTQFIDTALELMKFSSLSQLLCNMATCVPLESRDRIKNFLIENDFGRKLCNAFKASTDFIALENIGLLWSDYIKHMRDFCYTYDKEDELLQNLEHPDLITELLEHMFPKDVANRDPSAVLSGCLVLMAILDRQYDSRLPSIDLNKCEEQTKMFNHDPEYVCETLCSKHIADLLITTLEAVKEDDGDVATRCMIVLEAIFNTSHPKNHEQFVEQLKMAQFESFFDFVKMNPTVSLLNNSIHTLVSYMLHCSLAEEDHLVSYLFEDLGITSIILNALKEIPETGSSVQLFGARAFYNRLAERIIIAKEQSQNNARIMKHISELPDTLEWTDFADNKLQEYLQIHSTFDLSQTRTMSDVSSRIDFSAEEITDLEIDEWSTTLPPPAADDPAPSNVNEEEEDDELELFKKLKPISHDL